MSSGRPSIPRIHGEADLVHIRDLATAFSVMQQLKIPFDDVTDMADALARIKLNFRQSKAEQIYNEQDRVLREAVQADRSNRQVLLDLFSKAQSYLQSLPQHFTEDLHHMFPTLRENMDTTLSQLKKHDCIIVVAGEKGSGKSSLINLLAGCRVLPTDLLHGTRTICELRHSESRQFVAYHWDQQKPDIVKECRHEDDVVPFLQELTRMVTYVDQTKGKSPYMKIDIFWPLPILGEGVVMVDSPGVGESKKVSKQLDHYMSRAFGFIYVINIGNAGGIHKDRLGQLLRQAVERSDQTFDPCTALFVCNWWDQVDPAKSQHVLHETRNRLARVWPGVRENQIFPLSSTQALKAVERGQVEDMYRQLVKGIRQVLPITFNVKLSQHYRWLSAVLKRSLYSLKISSNVGRKEMVEKETAFRDVRNQIEALESESGTQIDCMRDGFRREVDSITRKLISFLKSEQCVSQLTRWVTSDLSNLDGEQKKPIKEAASRFRERLANIVDVWEASNKLVSKVKANVLKSIKKDLELFEDQVQKVEGVLFEGMDKRIVSDLHSSMRAQMPVKNVWRKARKDKGDQSSDMAGCFSLGAAISGGKVLDLKASPVKAVLKSGVSPQAMGELSRQLILQFKEEDIQHAAKKFFDRIAKRFDAASRLLPEFLKADRRLLQTLQDEVQEEQERLAHLYPGLISTVTSLQGNLDVFFVRRLMRFDFSMKELKYDVSSPIGQGAFALVYRCQLAGGQDAALKVQRNALTPKSVTDVLLEDRTLRDIQHKHIVRYFGAGCEKRGAELRWIMVMEYCPRTIKQRFMVQAHTSTSSAPARQEIVSLQVDAMREMALLAEQICSGLCYLHSKGIVHRDLKPDNILLTADDSVRLTDVGLAKSARDIAGTLAGTPVYMAPEVLLQTGQYDMKADVYSLAIILWELWYWQDAADHISAHLFRPRLEDAVRDGLRPSFSIPQRPPDDWLSLVQSGWAFQAKDRPDSSQMHQFFQDFLARQH